MSRQHREETDWVGAWFDFVAATGECTSIRIGRRLPGKEAVEWSLIDHARFDGIGAFAQALRASGKAPTLPPLPELRETRSPSLFQRVLGFLRQSRGSPKPPAAWRGWDGSWKAIPGRENAPPTAVSWFSLSVTETERLAARARREGVSLNSWLLTTLTRAVLPELGSGANYWMIPVNLRGPIRRIDPLSNHASYLQFDIPREASARDVHALVARGLQRADHWGVWDMLNIGRFVGIKVVRRLYHLGRRSKNVGWVGTFSNIGAWNPIEPERSDWFFCPPVNRTLPVASGAVTIHGRLSLTLQAHPALTRDAACTAQWLSHWLREAGAEMDPIPLPDASHVAKSLIEEHA